MELVRGYSLVSEDGVNIQVSETPGRESVLLILAKAGATATASLNKEMFDALFDLKYKVEVNTPAEKEEVKV